MSLYYSIVVFNKKGIEVSYSRQSDGTDFDTKCEDSLVEFLSNFLCIDEEYLKVELFSPFGKKLEVSYKKCSMENSIFMVWEHFQD